MDRLQTKLGHRFKRLELLGEALSHRSYLQTQAKPPFPSYERLEFLGDSVLGMLVAEALFKRHAEKGEGELTKLKSNLVNVRTLTKVSKGLTLNKYVKLSEDEEKSGGRERNSILADCLEAVLGAIFLDGGIVAARRFIKLHILEQMEELLRDEALRNYKGELLEHMQARSGDGPHYEVVRAEGPDHMKQFTVAVYEGELRLATGTGLTKKEAEQNAAQKALERIAKLKKKIE